MMQSNKKPVILYVFGGEKAQGAEIVIERLMRYNTASADAHLLLSPGNFATQLLQEKPPYKISTSNNLKKLNRGAGGSISFYLKAIKNYFALSFQVYVYIKKHQIDVVHANTIVPATYLLPLMYCAPLLCRQVKWVWSDHDLQYFSKIEHRLSRLCLKKYDRTLVVSAAVKEKYREHKKCVVLYNGLDPEVFKPELTKRASLRASLRYKTEEIVIGFPGVVAPRKGQLEFIKVFNKLQQSFPAIRLLLAGGYEQSTLRYAAAVKREISESANIDHAGFIKDMCAFYNACDIVINNSDCLGSEPLGTTIYEAMACKKLVIASDTGGTKEIISDQKDGLLFKAEDAEALYIIMIMALKEKEKSQRIAEAARDTVLGKFNISHMSEKYNDILKQLQTKKGQHG
ncbi:glycosyltransferase family 4 protein [Pedobacter sp. MC2016-14]|uniref:glycosyltransferase family 4 protein n=1 Tax=Pedobacter sp. MC2016-14 TaxID=2897327 RepID=UPI001E2B0DF3|nr:glycosyltransferase family 4 protein [Pedobacter sp. MC2016-14]MCD0486955.1 glycosyltransferase family 4 protein [Pedobacter sp. MC2016-14]